MVNVQYKVLSVRWYKAEHIYFSVFCCIRASFRGIFIMDSDLRLRNDHEMQGNDIPSLFSTDIYKNTCIV